MNWRNPSLFLRIIFLLSNASKTSPLHKTPHLKIIAAMIQCSATGRGVGRFESGQAESSRTELGVGWAGLDVA